MDLFRNFQNPNYGGGGGSPIYQGPFDLNAPLASSAYDPTTGMWSGNTQVYQGPFDLSQPLQQFGGGQPSQQINPPGHMSNIITPPASLQQQGAQQAQQAAPTPSIPLPGQLGALANQSILAQSNMHQTDNNLLGGNWSSMF